MNKYKQSKVYDEKLLHDVLKLDATLYPHNLQGTKATVAPRFEAYPEMFIYRYDKEQRLRGYLCFFPITPKLETKITTTVTLFDDNITAHDIVEQENNAYLIISVAVSPFSQQQKVATLLLQKMIAFLNKKNKPITIYAYVINEISTKLFTHANFNVLKKINNDVTLYVLKIN